MTRTEWACSVAAAQVLLDETAVAVADAGLGADECAARIDTDSAKVEAPEAQSARRRHADLAARESIAVGLLVGSGGSVGGGRWCGVSLT